MAQTNNTSVLSRVLAHTSNNVAMPHELRWMLASLDVANDSVTSQQSQPNSIEPATTSGSVVLIVGMHRSGTSAIAGTLHSLGLPFGDSLLPANTDNPRGFFEDADFVRLNATILKSLGSSWNSEQEIQINDAASSRWSIEVAHLLKYKLAATSNPAFTLKDPRISLLLPIYLRAVRSIGYEPVVIFVRRNEDEIIRSLQTRNKMSFDKARALTCRYIRAITENISGVRHLEVNYADALTQPRAIASTLLKFVHPDYDDSQIENQILLHDEKLRAFLDPSLRHHSSTATT